MYHLPAYVALARLVLARRVVVVLPADLEGPRSLLRGGAREVLVIADDLASEPGIVVRPGSTQLPLRDRSVDVVCCVEALGALAPRDRRELFTEAHRVLRPDGFFAAWVEHAGAEVFGDRLAGSPRLDFWTLEDELRTLFDHVAILAQMPWRGFSVAPVPDEDERAEPVLALEEGLLEALPEASHYLAVAGKSALPAALVRDCLLIPVPNSSPALPGAQALEEQVESMRDEVERLREELSLRAARSAAAQSRVRELESQLVDMRTQAGQAETAELETIRQALVDADEELENVRIRANQEGVRLRALEGEHGRLEAEHAELAVKRAELETQLGERTRDGVGSREQLEILRRELESERQQADAQKGILRSRETDLAILSRSVGDQEKALARVNEALAERKRELDRARAEENELRRKLEAVAAERDELRRQVDVSMAEREGARQLAARVEAQLEVTTRRLTEHEEALAAKIEEASRLDVLGAGMRQRLSEQESQLAQTRERAEELTAKATQGQMLTEVAIDRDRLREELTNRQQQITKLEERLWDAREGLQKEKLDAVRLSSDVDRLREQLERSRTVEKERTKEVERLATELRRLEVERAELKARLEARNERITQLEGEAVHRVGASEDAKVLNEQLQKRGNEIARVKEQMASLEQRRVEAVQQAQKRADELRVAGDQLAELRRIGDDQAKLAGSLQSEIDVKSVEIEQIAAAVGNLQTQIADYRDTIAADEQKHAELQRKLEQSASEQRGLRQRLREREQELEDLGTARETETLELFKLRQELESASRAAENLEEELDRRAAPAVHADPGEWPAAAQDEVRRLKDELAAQGRRHVDELTKQELERARTSGDASRIRRIQLEATIRAGEQECMLAQLDSAEQKIWEMTDASDRNAARFEASLANLEKHKEEIDRLADELEVTRNLLGAEQARLVELERLLASERAKLARAGLGTEGFPQSDDTDDPFAGFEHDGMLDLTPPARNAPGVPRSRFDLDSELVRLSDAEMRPQPLRPEPGAVTTIVDDRGSTRSGSQALRDSADRAPNRARIHVEAVPDEEDDGAWPGEDS